MTEPRRLTEDGVDPLQKQLLIVGRSYRASSQTRARTAAALGIGLVPLAATSKAAAATASPLAKIATVGIVATSASFLAYQAFAPAETTAPVHNVVLTSQPSIPAPPAAAPIEPAEPEPPAAEVGEKTAAPSVHPPVVNSPPAAAPRTSDALSAELARLDGARKKLAAGQSAAALEALDAYGREFPRGSLRLEASVLRIEALAKAGRASEARERAKRFLAVHPNSVLATRVKRYAGE